MKQGRFEVSLTIRDVRIACLGVEANMAPLNGKGGGPLQVIGQKVGYEDLFDKARDEQDGLRLPWAAATPKASQFWKYYVTERLQEGEEAGWSSIARNALVPLRRKVDLPVLELPAPTRRSFVETYVWQTGVGVCWNAWINKASLSITDLVGLLDQIRNGTVDVRSSADGTVTRVGLKALYNESLDRILSETLGALVKQDNRSDPMLVVTMVAGHLEDDTASARTAAREELFDALENALDKRPAKIDGDTRGDDQTVYAASGLLLAWNPKFLLKQGRVRKLACLHRNLVQSSLQAEMLARSSVRLSRYFQEGGLPATLGDTKDRVCALSQAIVNNTGYSSPALRRQLTRKEVAAARGTLCP
jgi:hypothetical protein